MAEVGVLNLTIKDNSEKAGQGLSSLADALTAVKTALEGFNLSPVGQQVTQLAKTIQDAKGTSTIIKNLGTLFNSVNQFSKIKSFTIDTDKIRSMAENMLKLADAKERVDEATKSGAGVSDWRSSMGAISESTQQAKNNIEDAAESIEKSSHRIFSLQLFGSKKTTPQVPGQIMMDLDGTAQRMREIVEQMSVTDAVMQKITENVSTTSDKFNSAVKSDSVVSPMEMISRSLRDAQTNVKYYGSALDTVLPKVQSLSSEEIIAAKNAEYASMSLREQKVLLAELNGEIKPNKISSPVGLEQTQSVVEFNIALRETGDIIESVIIPRFQEMYQIWSMMAYEFGAFQMQAARLSGGSNPLLLGDGKTPGQLLLGDGSEPNTFLSLWVDAGEQFKTDWVLFVSDVAEQWRAMWSPDWVLGGWQVPVSMSTFHLGSGESPLLLGDGGVSPDKMLSTWVDTSEQWKQNWIVGDGYVSDAIEETEQVAAATRDAAKAAEEYDAKLAAILAEKQEEATLAAKIRSQQESSFYAEKPQVGLEQTNQMADNLTKLDLLNAQLREAEINYNRLVNELGTGASKTIKAGLDVQRLRDAIWEYNNALNSVTDAQEETTGTAFSLSGAWSSLKGAVAKMFPTLTGLMKRFKSMATMRALRYVIRQLAAGFSEGVQNVYHYSKAVGTTLAPAMDQAATALQQLKNSIGAAVAPVIQALVPVLQNVVNWLITSINYLNQFFALLNGQSTWTRALPESAEAFEKNTKAAKGAGKAMKDLLADWDELNIIQSQNSGGGGSGAGKTAEEYKNMFEEVNSFDDKVKNAIAFIDEHLGGLPGLLKKAGLALLGWKFSKAFTGVLGTIGKFVAGGALVSIGLDFVYGAAYDAGSKGYFDTQDILRSIVGGLATALGGSLITSALGLGGVLGFGIGLMVAAVMTIVGYCQGEKDLEDKRKWGNLSYTREQIYEFVKKQFTFDVESAITVLDGVITNEVDAKRELDEKITKFKDSLQDATIKAGISVDSSETGDAVTQAANDARDAITAVEGVLKANNDGITVLMKTFKFVDAEGNDISEDLLTSISIADQSVKTYFTDIGSQLAHWVTEGETKGWSEDITKSALALMEREQKILQKAKEYKDQFEFDSKIDYSMSQVIDRETAQTQLEIQKQLLSEYENKARDALQEQFETASYLAGLATASADDALEQANAAQESGNIELFNYYMDQYNSLTEAAETYLKEAEVAQQKLNNIDDELVKTKEEMARGWAETLQKVYGKDYIKDIDKLINKDTSLYPVTLESVWKDPFGIDYLLGPGLKTHSYDETAELLKERLISDLEFSDWSGATTNYFENLGGSLWEFLEEDARKQVASNLLSVADSAGYAYEIFKRMFGLDEETAKKYIDPMYQDIWADVLEDQPAVDVTPNIEIDENALLEQLKEEAKEALQDGKLELDEQIELMAKYSHLGLSDSALFDILEELEIHLDEEGYSTGKQNPKQFVAGMNPLERASRVSGGMGISDVGWTPAGTNGLVGENVTIKTEPANDQQDADNVAEGTQRGTSSLLDALNTLVDIARAINRKEFTVSIIPSSLFGGLNRQSEAMYGAVTGDDNP